MIMLSVMISRVTWCCGGGGGRLGQRPKQGRKAIKDISESVSGDSEVETGNDSCWTTLHEGEKNRKQNERFSALQQVAPFI